MDSGRHKSSQVEALSDLLCETFPLLMHQIPLFPVIVALYVFPTLLQTAGMFNNYTSNLEYEDKNSFYEHLKEFLKHLPSSLRGSAFGAFTVALTKVMVECINLRQSRMSIRKMR